MNNKKTWIVVSVVILAVVMGIVGVVLAGKDPEQNGQTEPTAAPFRIEIDEERTDLPARVDTEQIKEGMSASEVYAILGKPQRDVGSGTVVLQWDLDSGEVFTVSFVLEPDDTWYVVGSAVTTPENT